MKYIVLGIPEEKYDSLMRQMALDRNLGECEITEIPEEYGNMVIHNLETEAHKKSVKS